MGETGCHTGRIDEGAVIAGDICIEAKGKGEKKVIDCFDVTSETAERNSITGKYESIAQCPTSYEIVDCNSFVTELAECDSSGVAVDWNCKSSVLQIIYSQCSVINNLQLNLLFIYIDCFAFGVCIIHSYLCN